MRSTISPDRNTCDSDKYECGISPAISVLVSADASADAPRSPKVSEYACSKPRGLQKTIKNIGPHWNTLHRECTIYPDLLGCYRHAYNILLNDDRENHDTAHSVLDNTCTSRCQWFDSYKSWLMSAKSKCKTNKIIWTRSTTNSTSEI
jgi:hypothetical protein